MDFISYLFLDMKDLHRAAQVKEDGRRKAQTKEAITKRSQTQRHNRNERFREAFRQYNWKATVEQLGAAMRRDPSSIMGSMHAFMRETPSLVRKCGTVPSTKGGRDKVIYEWLILVDQELTCP